MAKKKIPLKAKYQKVLLIDDDGIDNFINERIITTSDFSTEVIVKDTVKGALEFLEKNINDASSLPSIIFLDLNMPLVNGFDFLDEYQKLFAKSEAVKKSCKVIVLSSSVSPDDISRVSLNPHVYKFLNKPLTESYLNAINY